MSQRSHFDSFNILICLFLIFLKILTDLIILYKLNPKIVNAIAIPVQPIITLFKLSRSIPLLYFAKIAVSKASNIINAEAKETILDVDIIGLLYFLYLTRFIMAMIKVKKVNAAIAIVVIMW